MASTDIQHDAAEPALEPRRVAQTVEREIGLEHCLLRQLLRAVLLPDQSHGEPPGSHLISLREYTEGVFVALARQLNQFDICSLFHRRTRYQALYYIVVNNHKKVTCGKLTCPCPETQNAGNVLSQRNSRSVSIHKADVSPGSARLTKRPNVVPYFTVIYK